ncbi:MAG TPA: hypothetical protein PKC50_02345, partial [Elusimicrobiota bacterium]|nr:hypothetical protein [Elusimicrobiota bacterium]
MVRFREKKTRRVAPAETLEGRSPRVGTKPPRRRTARLVGWEKNPGGLLRLIRNPTALETSAG